MDFELLLDFLLNIPPKNTNCKVGQYEMALGKAEGQANLERPDLGEWPVLQIHVDS